MKLALAYSRGQAMAYDADRMERPDPNWFDPHYWQEQGCVVGAATGRGRALLLDGPFGPAVLRPYLRGGWAARFSHDRYLFTGYRRSRPLAEATLLSHMLQLGLPVPRPIAAHCTRQGLYYTGALLMQRIEPAAALADAIGMLAEDDPAWPAVGCCIRRFHQAGISHPDLNARNILLSGEPAGGGHSGAQPEPVWLIDFDRAGARQRRFGGARQNNLNRLHRSLTKLWPPSRQPELAACWNRLLDGYNEGT